MTHQFNWNQFAFELAPMAPYIDFYTNQPRIYMFEGATLIDIAILLATVPLAVFWMIYLLRSQASITKALMTIATVQIVINLLVRLYKTFILYFIAYPTFSSLFIASSVETTFHYTLYLQYTSSVLVYFLLRKWDVIITNVWSNLYYLPTLFIAIPLSVLNVNFNTIFRTIPFYAYVALYVAFSFSNIIILITLLASCCSFTKHMGYLRCRLFSFIIIASPPIIFNTVITIMDLLFMVITVTENFPIPYLIMTTYRYKAFEATPLFILLSFLPLAPDLKPHSSSSCSATSSSVVTTATGTTEAITHRPQTPKSIKSNITTETSFTETVSLPGEIVSQHPAVTTATATSKSQTKPQTTTEAGSLPSPPSVQNPYPETEYGYYSSSSSSPPNGRYGYVPAGNITVHIQGMRY